MNKKILIVEDEFIVANDLSIILENAGYEVCGIADSVEEAKEMIGKYGPELVLLDIHLKGQLTGIDLAKQLGEQNIAFVYLSANSNQKILEEAKATSPYGFMVKPFREKDVLVSLEIAQYLHEQNMLVRKNSELLLQGTLADLLAETGSWAEKFLKLAKLLQPQIPFDYLAIGMKNMDILPYRGISFLRMGFNEYQTIGFDELLNISGLKKQELLKIQEPSADDSQSQIYNDADFMSASQQNAEKNLIRRAFKMMSNLSLFIPVNGHNGFTISFYSRKNDTYNSKHLRLTKRLQKPMGHAINGILNVDTRPEEATKATPINLISKNKGAKPFAKQGFEGIIGKSHLLLTALDHLTLVAPMDTSVLILGESGTGKERFAKSIHGMSLRKSKPMVTVNCAALPTHLIESELFGHEKGAFTGAVDRRIGKFEQANGGTIFLDEIGELPLESQAKLLRVLQEKEIERLGGRETLKVDVRVIAATNCNLEKEVSTGKFRLDLYYRLNIFPILLPALRERKEDLAELATFFVEKYGEKAGKPGMSLSTHALNEMAGYNWPGNVRELEHLIERSVLLNRGLIIDHVITANKITDTEMPVETNRIKSIDDNERDYILSVLKKCNGRISGPGGAAELLEVPSTTLNSKMKRLGITRKHVSGY
ncbi:sigma 54-interacting transcriptional regulator [Pedobacter fastidiosus]|uniref:Sigma 54-interacting transcriptional regulator n=1 Tax=Pedobacter fastidiosus TaxID=2765361 RepID=A0ABR7KT39_9SPHI|nr:sigma 54-interacting transcriptional regulator [Pedobacter fastidiosus]MBC6110903.1 sigma 54-interacting transcriptional regulator [Pedobacter fastidiosus]